MVTGSPPVPSQRGGELNAALARSIVRCHARLTGRGPSKARAFFDDNLVVVMLENVMTPAERTLAEAGKQDTVLELRRELMGSTTHEMVRTVEGLTGCAVAATLSDSNLDPDLTLMVFVLASPISG
jgi:uncharacterized protein YbcI